MMPVIELPEGKASLVLLLADQFPEGQAAERCSQLLVAGLPGGDPHACRRPDPNDGLEVQLFICRR
jgi:hypothetical protein